MKPSLNKTEPKIARQRKARCIFLVLCVFFLATAAVGLFAFFKTQPAQVGFIGQTAFRDVQYQVSLGARTPGSEAHAKVVEWLHQQLTRSGWLVEEQDSTLMGHSIQNIVAKRGTGTPWIIIGAHYD